MAQLISNGGQTLACHSVYFGDPKLNNIACKCNSTHCDRLNFDWPQQDDLFLLVRSDKSGARFEQTLLRPARVPADTPPPDYTISVEAGRRLQEVSGFGGAFTDSAAQLISELPAAVRAHALEDYFGASGLGYNLGRVPIGGTDMSTRPYSYNDLPDGEQDLELAKFALQREDLHFKIPLIKAANRLRAERNLEPLKLMAASWSAPAWMKSNNNLVQGRLKRQSVYYDAYARYLIKFLHEYERQNVSMWALSPQNEPLSPKRVGPVKINFNSVNFEPEEMVDYLEHSVLPALIAANKTADKLKLFIWDDTLDGLERYQAAALAAPKVRDFTHGLALHWYSQGLHEISYRHLHEARRHLPAQYSMISTEASFIGFPKPGDWARGQRYARDIIENLRAGSVAWIDWNLALNLAGGPTWSRNFLDSALLVDANQAQYFKNPMFYALGHLSRFIEPKSRVLPANIFANGSSVPIISGALQDELSAVAAELERPLQVSPTEIKRRLALVLLNRVGQSRQVEVKLQECGAKLGQPALRLELPANSLSSLAFVC